MIQIKQEPFTEELKNQIYQGFARHATATTGNNEKFDPVAFIARKEKDLFAGAVVVEKFWGALHVKYVYVEEKYREHGIGTKLMESVLGMVEKIDALLFLSKR